MPSNFPCEHISSAYYSIRFTSYRPTSASQFFFSVIYTDAPKFAFIVSFCPEKDIVNLKCRSSIFRKTFDLLIH